MSQQKVADLYDQLLATEHTLRSGADYPIHKFLKFEKSHITDIYHWILDEIGLPQKGEILDAGCGVGWGTSFLARNTSAQLVGISVSPAEIEHANKLKSQSSSLNNPSFHQRSFDQLYPGKYSMIVAVESIKHSVDISSSISNLLDALTPNGVLVIVDDLYNGGPGSALTKQFASDWQLAELLSTQHLKFDVSLVECREYDFTPLMLKKSIFSINVKLWLISFLLLFNSKHNGWQAFRGGFCLDKLYAQNKMHYKATVVKKGSD